jgi:phosphatidyl-myo-inositol dimannoside synthase
MAGNLRALVLTPDFPPEFGGIQLLMHRLVTHFEQVEPTIVTLASGGSPGFDRTQPYRIVRAPSPPRLRRAARIALLNVVAVAEGLRLRPGVVLCGHISASPAARVLQGGLGIPYVQYLHGREVVTRPRLTTGGMRAAAAVVAVSRYTERLAAAYGADERKVHRIPPGVDLPATDGSGPKANGSERTIVSIARLDQRYKGLDVLLRAMPLVRAKEPGARLLVVGDGPRRGAYEHLADAVGSADYASFLGLLPDPERDAVLAGADVFAMPSRLPSDGGGEGFGIVYLEAAALGVPSVAGAVAGALDAVVDGQTGILVDPRDHVAVAEALSGLLSDRPRAEALGRAAAERAQEYAWPVVSRRVEDLLLRVAAGR